MMRQVGITDRGADPQAAVGKFFYLVQRQAIDIDELVGALDVQFHQIEQSSSAGDELGLRLGSGLNGLRYAGGLGVREHLHVRLPMLAGERPEWQRRCWGTLRSGRYCRS